MPAGLYKSLWHIHEKDLLAYTELLFLSAINCSDISFTSGWSRVSGKDILPYVISQLLGGIAAAAVLYIIATGNGSDIGNFAVKEQKATILTY